MVEPWLLMGARRESPGPAAPALNGSRSAPAALVEAKPLGGLGAVHHEGNGVRTLEEIEREAIVAALHRFNGHGAAPGRGDALAGDGPPIARPESMLIDQLTNAGALPSLELTMRFAAQRQRLTAHNIANLDTPNFIQRDASPAAFQRVLDDAVTSRRRRTGGMHGDLDWRETRELRRETRGLVVSPATASGGVLFHDRNNRDLERLMQALTESTTAFRVASDLYRSQRGMLHGAIAERVV
jgi:flagellar basal-body rod protein FlgB